MGHPGENHAVPSWGGGMEALCTGFRSLQQPAPTSSLHIQCLFSYKVSALCLGLQEGGSRLIVATGNCALWLLNPGSERQRGGSPRKSWDASE